MKQNCIQKCFGSCEDGTCSFRAWDGGYLLMYVVSFVLIVVNLAVNCRGFRKHSRFVE